MTALFIRWFGPTVGRIAFYIFLAILIAMLLLIGRCSYEAVFKSGKAAQAEQTTRSADALSNAAEHAVETVIQSSGRDASIDEVVIRASKDIDNAQDPVAARDAVINSVCDLAEYNNDPACKLRGSHP